MSDPLTNLIIAPFTVVVDTSEQMPWTFQGFQADARENFADIIVPTTSAALKTGDYSIEGLEEEITVERKSLADAFGTFGGGRARWYREMERMRSFRSASVIIEADIGQILQYKPKPGKSGRTFTPKHFYRSLVSWRIRYPTIQWWLCPTRYFADRTCYRTLARYWELRDELIK